MIGKYPFTNLDFDCESVAVVQNYLFPIFDKAARQQVLSTYHHVVGGRK